MSMLQRTLEGSCLLRPWVWLAQRAGLDWAQWIQQSCWGRWIGGFQDCPQGQARWMRWGSGYQLLLAVGLVLLLILLSVAGTAWIGLGVWALLGWVMLGALVFRPRWLARLTVIDVLVGAFLASAVLSTAFSSFVATSVLGLVKMLTFVAGYGVFRVYCELGGGRAIVLALSVLAGLGLVEALVGFYQYVNHIQPLATWTDPSLNPELQMTRIFGTLQPSNPNLLAGFLTPCLAAAAGLSLLCLPRNTWPLAVLLAGASVAILAALVLTGSRGGFLAMGVMALGLFLYMGHLIWREPVLAAGRWLKPVWVLLAVGAVLLAGLAFSTSEPLRHRMVSIFSMREDSSISYRLNVYQSSMAMFRDNPVVGIGPGNGTFKLVYGLYMVPGYNALGAYSVPLEIAVEQGAVGLGIFLSLLLVLILRTGLAVDSSVLSWRQKVLMGALLTGILGSFAYGAFDTIWYRPSVNLVFWLMVAGLAYLTELPLRVCALPGGTPVPRLEGVD